MWAVSIGWRIVIADRGTVSSIEYIVLSGEEIKKEIDARRISR